MEALLGTSKIWAVRSKFVCRVTDRFQKSPDYKHLEGSVQALIFCR
jgi:hypothetical protein